MGNGLYGAKLSYQDWFEFQLDQRAHKNFLEQLTILVFCSLLCGLIYPTLTLVCVSIIFVGRIIFTAGYKTSVKARFIGGPFVMITTMVLIISTIVGAGFFIGQTQDALNATTI